jgi:16S rRNA (uracil1498-N3)-methyltransferase
MPRFYCPAALTTGALLELPAGAARHVQVLRLQPGDPITLFNGGWDLQASGLGGEFEATVTEMGRSHVQVRVGAHHAVEREPARAVHLAVGMPANDRMDWLIEKATELGVTSIQPLLTERSVLRLQGERAEKKVAHWQSVAIAACEQCGGNRVPLVHPVLALAPWLKTHCADTPASVMRMLLSLREGARPLRSLDLDGLQVDITFLSGPEGGLSAAEEDAAAASGYKAVTLGPRVLRSETAALAALAGLML